MRTRCATVFVVLLALVANAKETDAVAIEEEPVPALGVDLLAEDAEAAQGRVLLNAGAKAADKKGAGNAAKQQAKVMLQQERTRQPGTMQQTNRKHSKERTLQMRKPRRKRKLKQKRRRKSKRQQRRKLRK